MDIVTHPLLLSFLFIALLALLLSLFIKRGRIILVGIAVILPVLYTINALLMGFPYFEVLIPLLLVALLMLIAAVLKERKR